MIACDILSTNVFHLTMLSLGHGAVTILSRPEKQQATDKKRLKRERRDKGSSGIYMLQ